jgi:molybdopterin-guanine dinucleotide biosynthesis protein A
VTPVPAIVLAGGKSSPEFAAESGAEYRSQAEIDGWPMLRYVVHALKRAETIREVIVVAPSSFPREPEADQQLPGDGDIGSNLLAGAAACGDAEFALIVTADVPFLTPEAVDAYVRTCAALEGDCLYAAVSLEACKKQFPEMKRTALHTPAGAFTGGNTVYQRVSTLLRQIKVLREAHAARKNPLFLVRLIGLRNVLRFLLRRLTLEEIGRAASRVIGVRCLMVPSDEAVLGTDVDRPEDLRLARRLLRREDSARPQRSRPG